VEVSVWPVGSRGSWRLNAFVRDITQRKRDQENLAIARDEALESSRLKSEFLANMSHEIRTPMNGVLGMTSILLNTDLSVEQRAFAETVRGSGEVLLEILNDILDFSKIEAGHLGLDSIDFNLRALVEDVAGLLSLPAHEKGLELVCSLPPHLPATFRGDPGRLRQVVTNLMSNAVKFTPTGEVLLQMTLAGSDTAPIARFEVTDTGIGIAEADLGTIFESFRQADAATTRRYGGTGLGLAICSQLVKLMGGEIGVRSEFGRGSTFWFSVSLEKGTTAAFESDLHDLTGLRMLVVDDNATNRSVLMRFLHSWKIRSSAADGAAQARQAIAAAVAAGDPFDAALLDLNMPEVDGIELARTILADWAPRAPRLLLLTSSGQAGEARKALEAGIDAYLNKPIRQSQLFDCLCTMMTSPLETGGDISSEKGLAVTTQKQVGRILLAEDNVVNQKVATAMLVNLGYSVDVVADGEKAVEAARSASYQAILMDCQMPVLDGYQATSEIRRLEGQAPRTPIIAVTASAMKSDQERCQAAGMDDYLTKPLGLTALDDVMGRWVPRARDLHTKGDAAESPAAPATPASDLEDAPTSPVLDVEVIGRLERLGKASGEDLMGQLTELFLTDADARMKTLHLALARDDAAEVGRSAHTLSGASANLGATGLAQLCATLATDGAAGDLAGGGALLGAVEIELERVRIALTTPSPTA
jgi:two-component system, sensor histidine kinase and response regulator